MTIRLLDCTLRDGGYVNEFSFRTITVQEIIKNLIDAGIDYIECGFLKNSKQDTETTVFLSDDDLKTFIPSNKKKTKLFAMIVFGTFDIEKLPPRKETCIDGIRVTFKKKEIPEALRYLKKIKDLGYIISANPTGIHSYSDMELLKLLEEINYLKPDIFSIVDTLGVMNATDLLKKFYLVENNLDKKTIIGFHSHNNLQQSFTNAKALCEIRTARDLIIDVSVMGMGRGAGNLNAELMISYLNENYGTQYDLLPILKIIDEHISKIYSKTPWGYSMPYFLAASVKCHPNYASYLIDKQTISIEAINSILLRIPDDKKASYDAELIKRLYLEYQENAVDDENIINALKTEIGSKPILIVAPGKTIETHKSEIGNFILSKKPFVISLNFRPDMIKTDKVFISNAKRFSEQKDFSNVIVTSNIKSDLSTLNYASYLNDSEMYDNSVLMFLVVLMKLGIHEVYAAGLDGFKNNDNYANPAMVNNAKLGEFDKRNDIMREMIQRFEKQIKVHFITPSFIRRGKMKYRLVIWDVDGTLLDTREGLTAAYQYTLNVLKLPAKSDEEICSYIGPTPQTVFKTRFGLNDEPAQRAADIFRERYKMHDLLKARVYDGVYDVMEQLKKNNVKQAIATNKRQDYATEICQHFGFDKYCFPIVGVDNENKSTKADLIRKCLETLNVTNLSEAVMIGDTQGDKTAAETVGIDFIGVNYGFGFKDEQCNRIIEVVNFFEDK